MRTSFMVILCAMNAIVIGFTMFLFYCCLSTQYIDITYLMLHEEPHPEITSPQSTANADICACNRPGIKIFNLGLMKAGSTSIYNMMKKFGCRSLHHGLHPEKGQDPYINVTRWSELPLKDRRWTHNRRLKHSIARVMFLAEKYGHPLLYYFENDVSAFSQLDDTSMELEKALFPQMTQFKKLHEEYPDAKFILIKRNVTAHIASMWRWGSLRKRLNISNVPYLPPGKGGTEPELEKWIKRHYQRVNTYFTRRAPEQYLEIQLEDDGDYNMARIEEFTHCTGNFSMLHENKNNRTEQSFWKDRSEGLSRFNLTEQKEKYINFWEEMTK